MNILFLSHYYKPEEYAAASRVSALAERWVKEGHNVTILTCVPSSADGKIWNGYKNKLRQTEVINGVKVIRCWTYIASNKEPIKRMFNFLTFMFSTFLVGLTLPRPDIMVATSGHIFCGLAGAFLSIFRKLPFVLEIRDIWPESASAVGAKLPIGSMQIASLIEKIMYNSADHIVTLGMGYLEKLVERNVSREKISVVMNGVDKTLFYPRPRNEELLKKNSLEDKFICSYIGTIGMACGLATAVDAAEILQKQGNDKIRIVLIGDGAVREKLEEDAKKRNLKNIVFLGHIAKSEIPEWVASSDINLVHLKKTELFATVMPSKIFESAGCARPVLMAVNGFAKKLVEDANMAVSIEPEDAQAMADALVEIQDKSDFLSELGENGHKNVASVYDRDSQAKNYLGILSNVLKSKK